MVVECSGEAGVRQRSPKTCALVSPPAQCHPAGPGTTLGTGEKNVENSVSGELLAQLITAPGPLALLRLCGGLAEHSGVCFLRGAWSSGPPASRPAAVGNLTVFTVEVAGRGLNLTQWHRACGREGLTTGGRTEAQPTPLFRTSGPVPWRGTGGAGREGQAAGGQSREADLSWKRPWGARALSWRSALTVGIFAPPRRHIWGRPGSALRGRVAGSKVVLTERTFRGLWTQGLRQPFQTSRKPLDRSGCGQARPPRTSSPPCRMQNI